MEEAEVKQLLTQIRRRFPNAAWAPPTRIGPNENGSLHTYGGWRDTPRHAAEGHELGWVGSGDRCRSLFTKVLLPAAIHSFQRRPWNIYDHMLMYGGFGFALSLVSSLFMWVWALLGKQSLTLDGVTLVHRREILGIGFSREYEWSAVQDFRLCVQAPAQKVPGAPAAASFVFNLQGAAVMAFDYGARTFELGHGLDEPSASELVTRINQRFPTIDGPAVNA